MVPALFEAAAAAAAVVVVVVVVVRSRASRFCRVEFVSLSFFLFSDPFLRYGSALLENFFKGLLKV